MMVLKSTTAADAAAAHRLGGVAEPEQVEGEDAVRFCERGEAWPSAMTGVK